MAGLTLNLLSTGKDLCREGDSRQKSRAQRSWPFVSKHSSAAESATMA